MKIDKWLLKKQDSKGCEVIIWGMFIATWLSRWFKNIKPWEGDHVASLERFLWL